MPVSIHVADPRAFWLPYDEKNERWTELKDHRYWWFGDPAKYPPREELLAALDRVIERHPKTTFVCVHFANNAEDLDWVDRALDEHPNMIADLAARIPEVGRHDPEKVRRLFTKHADRIFFATDFMVYDKLILGSGGDADRPTDDDARDLLREVLALAGDGRPRLAAHDADPGRLDDQLDRAAARRAAEDLFRQRAPLARPLAAAAGDASARASPAISRPTAGSTTPSGRSGHRCGSNISRTTSPRVRS